jgi:hypothetical protein
LVASQEAELELYNELAPGTKPILGLAVTTIAQLDLTYHHLPFDEAKDAY